MASTAYDSGSSNPHSSSWGRMTAGMNWTAWNSLATKALTNSPNAVLGTALATASTRMSQARTGDVQPEHGERHPGRDGDLEHRERAEGQRVAEQQVQLRQRHGQQPLQRAGGALAQRGA